MDLNIPPPDLTLKALDQAIVAANPPSVRTYLQCNNLGQECERQTWYGHRWVLPSIFDALTLRRFEDGHLSEAQMATRIRMVPGVKLQTAYDDGSQFEVVDFGGHLQGHLDGVIEGVAAAPKTMHVWEHKCVNERSFKKLDKLKRDHSEKESLELWNGTYFGQAQLYMGLTGLKRHYLTVTTPGGRDITSCRTNFDSGAFKALIAKARRIFEATEPPPRISKKPDYYLCRWCNFSETCHGEKVAQVNCRTCAHSTPVEDQNAGAPGKAPRRGAWKCELHSKLISVKRQKEGCGDHIFIPALVPWAEVVKFEPENNRALYVTKNTHKAFANASRNDWSADPPVFRSKDLAMLDEELLNSESQMFAAFATFEGATLKSVDPADPFDDPIPPL